MFQKSRILQSGCNSLDCLIGEAQVSVESGCNKSMSYMSGTNSGELHTISDLFFDRSTDSPDRAAHPRYEHKAQQSLRGDWSLIHVDTCGHGVNES